MNADGDSGERRCRECPDRHSGEHTQSKSELIYGNQIREALSDVLGGAGLELVGEADTAREAIRLVVDLRPDVVLMHIKLPGSSSVDAIEQLSPHREHPRQAAS